MSSRFSMPRRMSEIWSPIRKTTTDGSINFFVPLLPLVSLWTGVLFIPSTVGALAERRKNDSRHLRENNIFLRFLLSSPTITHFHTHSLTMEKSLRPIIIVYPNPNQGLSKNIAQCSSITIQFPNRTSLRSPSWQCSLAAVTLAGSKIQSNGPTDAVLLSSAFVDQKTAPDSLHENEVSPNSIDCREMPSPKLSKMI